MLRPEGNRGSSTNPKRKWIPSKGTMCVEAESERSAPVCVQGKGKCSLEHGAEPRAVPRVMGEWAESARKGVKGQRDRKDLPHRVRFPGGLNQRREVSGFIFEKVLPAAVCRMNRGWDKPRGRENCQGATRWDGRAVGWGQKQREGPRLFSRKETGVVRDHALGAGSRKCQEASRMSGYTL